jgi:hypothetical protein
LYHDDAKRGKSKVGNNRTIVLVPGSPPAEAAKLSFCSAAARLALQETPPRSLALFPCRNEPLANDARDLALWSANRTPAYSDFCNPSRQQPRTGPVLAANSHLHSFLVAPGYQYDLIRRKRGHLGLAVQMDLFNSNAKYNKCP